MVSFSPESLRREVEAFARPEGRMVGSRGHEKARSYLVERLQGLGLDGYNGGPVELGYAAGGLAFTNIIARVPGTDSKAAPLLIAAHYDTAGPWPGADDNAAAVAVLLALAEPLRAAGLPRDVLLAFFDAEEPPYFLSPNMGSVHFYREQRTGPVHCALVMDLVGHDVPAPGLGDLLFITGMESDPELGNVIKDTPESAGLRVIPALNSYIGDLSDHHAFRTNRRPYLFLSCGHWEHYHDATDTPEKLNYVKMASLAQYLLALTRRIARTDLSGPFEGYDTTPIELQFMRRALGPLVQALGVPLANRKDIDRLAYVLIRQFGL